MSGWKLFFWTILFSFPGRSENHSTSTRPLEEALVKAAGVYIHPPKYISTLNLDLNKTVIITGANFGYINHLHNFKCFIDRLGLKVLVVSMDERTHKYVSSNMPSMTSLFWNGVDVVQEASTEFRTQQFHVITNRKKEAVLGAMKLGYNAIFIDTDVAVLRDPLSYLIWDRVDYVHSLNKICPK